MSVAEVSLASKAFLSAGVINAAMKPSREGRRIQGAVITRLLQCGLAEEGSSVRQLVWRCDRWLQRNHRNDHVYRTRVLNEVLHHERGALALPEFRVNSSKADFLVVGRDLHAFEIKSDVDNLDRLETQLRDYQAIAPRVSLVAPPRLAARVAESQEWDAIGVSTLASDGSIETWRPALADASSLSSVAMLRSLRRPEYLAALASLGHQIPLTPNTRIFAQSTQAAASIDPADFHLAAVAQLSCRRPRAGMKAIARVPRPLRAIVLRIDPGHSQLNRLNDWLNSEVGDVSSEVAGTAV